ncbi:hypothetical protein CRE_05154 [Caenorhabditis remanei]|uniref:Uncharacterized protein n=1 Tax=Caenorhabditis remanei TaxID=31234 RepID=E3N6C7_CAERE|nr:hypothetical protein CRE_05154 [Caenorhabditis remanei]
MLWKTQMENGNGNGFNALENALSCTRETNESPEAMKQEEEVPEISMRSRSNETNTLKEWGQRECSQKVAMEITNYAYECADLNTHYKSFTSELIQFYEAERQKKLKPKRRDRSDEVYERKKEKTKL